MRCCLALLVCLAACQASRPGGSGDDDPMIDARGSGSGNGSAAIDVFDPSTTNVIVEIDYETGQPPFTGPIFGFGDSFDPTLANIDRLFAGTKTLAIPTTLGEMQDVGTIPDEELTVTDIIALADMHRDERDRAGTKTYYMIFVSGHFADGTGPRTSVLGVAIGDTIAMFKDVIRGTSNALQPNVVRYVEQSTLIHELAHSIGLVDNGVAMQADHKDEAHGPHCTNPDCVMFWLNEGASDASDFAVRRLITGSTLLFDASCLADVDARTGGP